MNNMITKGSKNRNLPERMSVGVIIERKEIQSRWADYSWLPVAVIPGAPAQSPIDKWRVVSEGNGWTRYHAATFDIELFRGETAGYKVNLANFQPHVYVVLTPGEELDEPEIVPLLVTVCPYEAESYTEDSEQLVEGVTMPAVIIDWISNFVDQHHIDVPFKKRKRKKAYDPRKGDFERRIPVRETDK